MKERENNSNSLVKYNGSEPKEKSRATFRTSTALLDNLTARRMERQEELGLFSDTAKELLSNEAKSFYDAGGKPVKTTTIEKKAIIFLCREASKQLDNPDWKTYIEKIPDTLEKRVEMKLKNGTNSRLKQAIELDVDVADLATSMYRKASDKNFRLGGDMIPNAKKVLLSLSKKCHLFAYKREIEAYDPKTKKQVKRKEIIWLYIPLIALGADSVKALETESEKYKVINKVEVTLDDIFFYKTYDNYAETIDYLPLLNDTGIQDELSMEILLELIKVHKILIKDANKQATALRKKLAKEKLDRVEINNKVEALRRKILTYSESILTLLDRIESKTTYTRSRYGRTDLRIDKIRPVLDALKDALLHIGIIKDYYETIGDDGAICCNFVINENWTADERKKLREPKK